MNTSEAVLRGLVDGGVEACFANPGTSEMHLVASFDRVGGLRPILGLFEGVCTGAADGYARMSEKPAATLLHLGPGLGNGLANIHNARRGSSRMINIVGDHATYHQQYDAPLQSDIPAIAGAVSHAVISPRRPEDALPGVREALNVSRSPNGGIATMLMPADVAWLPCPAKAAELGQFAPPKAKPVDPARIKAAAQALRASEPRVLFIGGRAGLDKPLRLAAAIAAKTGAKLYGDTFIPRLARGKNRPHIDRLAYLGEMALAQMKEFRKAVFVGTKPPVAFFAYPDKPSTFMPDGCEIHEPWDNANDLTEVLQALADEVGAKTGDAPQNPNPAMPPKSGALNSETFGTTIAALLPENAIVTDEAVTAGLYAYIAAQAYAPHDWLTLTGGAIGLGIPMSVGAAVACPDRPVINLQADGSAAYTIQALWTAARESLHVITLLVNNRAYAILNMELDRVGASAQSERSRSLLSLAPPVIDFSAIAKGFGVPSSRVTNTDELSASFKRAVATPGPHLIEAIF
jgi:acetolactate synthase-1/2/3 large subunit